MSREPECVARGEQMVLLVEMKGAGTCHVCHNPITWARTIDGALMPLTSELRVRALTSPDMRKRTTIRIAKEPGSTSHTERIRSPEHEAKLLEKGWTVREELALVWEMPASLTHWPHCRPPDRRARGSS